MKKSIGLLTISLALAMNTVSFGDTPQNSTTAKPDHKLAQTSNHSSPTAKSDNTTQIKLYAEPNLASATVATVKFGDKLIPFYQKDEWIKVGNPADGTVGWINKKEYRQAIDSAVQQKMQTIYIQQVSESGKPSKITVYQNGEKLTGDAAEAAYKNIQQQQLNMEKNMTVFQHQLNQWMSQQMQLLTPTMIVFPSKPLVQPLIILQQSGNNKTNNHPEKEASSKQENDKTDKSSS